MIFNDDIINILCAVQSVDSVPSPLLYGNANLFLSLACWHIMNIVYTPVGGKNHCTVKNIVIVTLKYSAQLGLSGLTLILNIWDP